MHTYIKARAIIMKWHKIFLVKDSTCGLFMLPWWTQEKGEKIEDTFYREVTEELWIRPEIDKFIWFKEYISINNDISLQFLFKVKNVDDYLNVDKENCSHWEEWSEAGFYDINDIEKHEEYISEDLKEVFYCTLFNKKYQSFL